MARETGTREETTAPETGVKSNATTLKHVYVLEEVCVLTVSTIRTCSYTCLSLSLSLASQYGWPEKWHMALGWSLRRNECENCEPGDGCGTHHQSPVPLDRQWGARKRMGDTGVMNCGDNHWMKYESGTCNWEHLVDANAITVERHALRISQPVEKVGDDYELDCYTDGRGRILSRMDMSGGKFKGAGCCSL